MLTIREELLQRLDTLSEDELIQVLDFVRLLQAEPESLTPEEIQELHASRAEVAQGEWVRWQDVKRTDA